MLPGLNGIEVCRRIRMESQVPIIALTAKDDVSDKVAGLDTGADDYMTKPFALRSRWQESGCLKQKEKRCGAEE